ncbi:MAG TPA: EAL domain-containing protein [Thermoanaerobaculia bacterium]|nr:EAL domain-containing protein [Thermoanaerobaculia bacterium]
MAWPTSIVVVALAALTFAAISVWASRSSRRREGSLELYRSIVEKSPDLISRLTESGTFRYLSVASESLLGYPAEELTGRSIFDIVASEDEASLREYLSTVCREPFPWAFNYRVERKDGRTIWVESNASCEDQNGSHEIIVYSRDVTERKRVEDHIAYLAYHDELTGLPNRTLFHDRLTIALAHARRYTRVVGVIFIDLDHFKRINDTLGHRHGDQLLDAVAQRLRECTRVSDTVARLGGDEFTVLLSEVAHEEDTARIARKVLEGLQQRFTIEGNHLFVSASMGIALFPRDGADAESLLKNADSAMYRAKNSGRNSYSFCTPESNARFLERLTLENSLRRAFEREEFVLYYQPVISTKSGRPVEMEALIRWNDPERGVVSPADFLTVAEDSRLMLPIGEWVLRSACRQARRWVDAGNPMRVAVNLSAQQLQAQDLEAVVGRAVSDGRIEPSLLHLEIAETVAAKDFEFTRDVLGRLKRLGIKVAIDDFGGGTSFFSELRELPIDLVKIDARGLRPKSHTRDAAILSSVISTARALDLGVIGKSVESAAQFEFLQQNHCDEMQGFLLGAPMPPPASALRLDH